MGDITGAARALRLIRVVAVSPSDVSTERGRLSKVVDEINRRVARERQCRLELWRWETDARPGLHLEGPQGQIDADMKIDDADVVIGVFWTRFGTPTHSAGSGTEHELQRAWAAWRERGSPQVMVYFSERKHRPKDASEAAQLAALLRFREAMPKEQLWWSYRKPGDFERAVREHLTAIVLDLDADTVPAKAPADPDATSPAVSSRYLLKGSAAPVVAEHDAYYDFAALPDDGSVAGPLRTVDDFHKVIRHGLGQLDRVLVGARAAKLAFLVACVGRLGVAFVGLPGCGKTTLMTRGLQLIRGIEESHLVHVPILADLAPSELVGGQPDGWVAETMADDTEGVAVIGMVRPEHRSVLLDHVNLVNPEAVVALAREVNAGLDGELRPASDSSASGVRMVVSTMNHDCHTYSLPDEASRMHAIAVDFDLFESDGPGGPAELILGGYEPADPDPVMSWADLDDMRYIARTVAIDGSLEQEVERYRQREGLQLLGDEEGMARAKLVCRILAACHARERANSEDLDRAVEFVLAARRLR